MVGPKAATEATTLTTRHLAQARCTRHPVSAATLWRRPGPVVAVGEVFQLQVNPDDRAQCWWRNSGSIKCSIVLIVRVTGTAPTLEFEGFQAWHELCFDPIGADPTTGGKPHLS